MRAIRVGRLPNPIPSGFTVCWRCGITFDHGKQNVVPGSPCNACRPILREEGDTTPWRRQRKDRRRRHDRAA